MSFFERLGLIEREEVAQPVPVVQKEETPVVEANAQINSAENVVNEIYAQNGMANKENSIYVVQSFMDTLPTEMTTAKKQSSVYGILKVSGKSVESLLTDADNRCGLLAAARDKVVAEQTELIESAKADIENLKKMIENATIAIKAAEELAEATAKAVNDEITVIEELVKFCEGMGEN